MEVEGEEPEGSREFDDEPDWNDVDFKPSDILVAALRTEKGIGLLTLLPAYDPTFCGYSAGRFGASVDFPVRSPSSGNFPFGPISLARRADPGGDDDDDDDNDDRHDALVCALWHQTLESRSAVFSTDESGSLIGREAVNKIGGSEEPLCMVEVIAGSSGSAGIMCLAYQHVGNRQKGIPYLTKGRVDMDTDGSASFLVGHVERNIKCWPLEEGKVSTMRVVDAEDALWLLVLMGDFQRGTPQESRAQMRVLPLLGGTNITIETTYDVVFEEALQITSFATYHKGRERQYLFVATGGLLAEQRLRRFRYDESAEQPPHSEPPPSNHPTKLTRSMPPPYGRFVSDLNQPLYPRWESRALGKSRPEGKESLPTCMQTDDMVVVDTGREETSHLVLPARRDATQANNCINVYSLDLVLLHQVHIKGTHTPFALGVFRRESLTDNLWDALSTSPLLDSSLDDVILTQDEIEKGRESRRRGGRKNSRPRTDAGGSSSFGASVPPASEHDATSSAAAAAAEPPAASAAAAAAAAPAPLPKRKGKRGLPRKNADEPEAAESSRGGSSPSRASKKRRDAGERVRWEDLTTQDLLLFLTHHRCQELHKLAPLFEKERETFANVYEGLRDHAVHFRTYYGCLLSLGCILCLYFELDSLHERAVKEGGILRADIHDPPATSATSEQRLHTMKPDSVNAVLSQNFRKRADAFLHVGTGVMDIRGHVRRCLCLPGCVVRRRFLGTCWRNCCALARPRAACRIGSRRP